MGGFFLWATSTPDPEPVAVAALASDELVEVTEADGYTFEPIAGAEVGFVLYPGARVDPASYAPLARQLAEAGYLVVVPEMPLNLAVLNADAADDVIGAHPDIDTWAIGGHSLGGAMAAEYVGDHPGSVAGLALWAAYPPGGTDLSRAEVSATSIFGTRDGLTSLDDIDDSRARLPTGTAYVSIEGGNHAQFGSYGPQKGDNPATVTATDQQAQIVEATLQMLEQLTPQN